LTLLLGLWGCENLINQQEIISYNCPQYTGDIDHMADVADVGGGEGDLAVVGEVGEVGEVGPGEPPWVGAACEVDDDCGKTGRVCVTKEFLVSMGLDNPDIDVPGGMCSMLFCGKDEECGPRGVCFDTTPFSGSPLKICLLTCEHLADCRWEESHSCYKLAQEDPMGACLPDSIVVAAECDDGHCEGQVPANEACDQLSDCLWKEGYSCLALEGPEAGGWCVRDSTAVAFECDTKGVCPHEPAEGGR